MTEYLAEAFLLFYGALQADHTNGLYSRNPGILFALDKGLKSVNCSNYPNFIQKTAFYPRKKFPPLTVVYVAGTWLVDWLRVPTPMRAIRVRAWVEVVGSVMELFHCRVQ